MGYFDPIPERKFILDDILKWIIDIIAFVALGIFFVIYIKCFKYHIINDDQKNNC